MDRWVESVVRSVYSSLTCWRGRAGGVSLVGERWGGYGGTGT